MCMKKYGVALDSSFWDVNYLRISHSTNEGPCYTQLSKFILKIVVMENMPSKRYRALKVQQPFVAVV